MVNDITRHNLLSGVYHDGSSCMVILWNPGHFCLWNLEARALESEVQFKEYILNTANDWNESGIQVPQISEIKYLESGIHCLESRIQGFLHSDFFTWGE